MVYRFPYRYDSELFVQKLAMFIEQDLKTNTYKDLNEQSNMFYVDVINGKIQFTDKINFDKKEREYLKNIVDNEEQLC